MKKIADRRRTEAPVLIAGNEAVLGVQEMYLVRPMDINSLKDELLAEIRSIKGEGISGEEMLTPAEAAKELKTTTKHLLELRKEKKISFTQDGRKILFSRTAIREYINKHMVNSR